MSRQFFVMGNSQSGEYIMPLVDGDEYDEVVMLFATLEEARDAAECNPYFAAFGYEIFERWTGES